MADPGLLIGDVGGTNARFALAEGSGRAGFHSLQTLNCADFRTPEEAIGTYLARLQVPVPRQICLAAAGPVINGVVSFTNNAWQLREDSLRATFRSERVRLINDFEAIACALPLLDSDEVLPLGRSVVPASLPERFTLAVIGPGTGLGAAALVGERTMRRVLVAEAGHVGFAPESPLQDAVLRELRVRFGRVSDERLISGPGMDNLYQALARVRGHAQQSPGTPEIFRRGASGSDPLAVEALALFFEILGQVAGNFALATGARDGVFIAGGIALRFPELLARSRFRAGFENKGRHRALMETIPVGLILHRQPGLLGASSVLRHGNSMPTESDRRHASGSV